MKTIAKIRLGKNMTHALDFCTKYTGWHCYARKCDSTVQTIRRLERLGIVETNKFFQFRKAVK